MHGHQASPPYFGRDYLSDYIIHFLGSSNRPKAAEEDGRERFKAEKRLYRAASVLRVVAIQGHTRRPLFESRSNRDSIRAEVERLLREGDPARGGSKIDELIGLYRSEERRKARRSYPSGPAYDKRSLVLPCLFSPGRVIGAGPGGSRGLRMLELEDGFLTMVRWASARRGDGASPPGGPGAAEPLALEGTPYLRFESRSASIQGLFERIDLLAPGGKESEEGASR
jgi:hypothetical protein